MKIGGAFSRILFGLLSGGLSELIPALSGYHPGQVEVVNPDGENYYTDLPEDMDTYGEASGVRDVLGNLVRKYGETGVTSRDIEMNNLAVDNMYTQASIDRDLRRTQYQDQLYSAQQAGINPYFALGGSFNSPAVSAPTTPAAGNHGDLAGLISTIGSLMMAFSGARKNNAETALLREQAGNVAADTKVKENTAGNLQEQTRGLALDNEWKQRTLDARTESENLRNSLTREQIRQTRKAIDVADEQISLMIKQEDSEVKKQQLAEAQALLARANAHQVFALTPYMQLELQARGDAEKASAQLSAVSAAYQQGLIDTGMIEAVVRQTNADADVKQVEHDLKQYQDDVNHGNISRVAGASDSVVGGLFATMKIALDQIKPGM